MVIPHTLQDQIDVFFFLTLPSQSYSTLPHCFNSCGFALAAILSLTIVESFRSLVQYIMLQNTQCKEDSSPARHSCLVLPRQFELVTDGFVWTQQLVLVILGRCRFDRRIYALFRHTTLLPKARHPTAFATDVRQVLPRLLRT